MSRRLTPLFALCAGSAFLASSAAFGQYQTGFEASDGITASAGGTVLTGQDNYYIPSGTVSTDMLAFTYSGNAYGVAANPNGGAQFVAVEGPGGGTYGRAQRDMNWGNTQATMEFDFTAVYLGAPPASDNIGSVSVQPYPGSASYIHLLNYTDINNPVSFQAGLLAYNSSGVADAVPRFPGPEWQNLTMNHWYHCKDTIDFVTNRITQASITDITTGATATVALSDYYLQGGSAGGAPLPTGFRLFSGGGLIGNVAAYDNVKMVLGGGCPSDFTATQSGTCPGPKQIAWTGAPANSTVRVLYTQSGGNGGNIPNGPCMGTRLCIGLGGITLHPQSLHSGAGGSGNTPNFNAPCGLHVQLITQTSCKTSNALILN